MPPVWLSETQSSAVHMLLVAGLALILPTLVDRRNNLHRSLLMAVTILVALRYAWWRATDTLAPVGLTVDFLASGSLFAFEMAALTSSISANLMMSRIRDRSAEASANEDWWAPDTAPRVSVLIATYNEDLEVLERTIVGSLAIDYPNFEVMVLDDGKRDWLRQFCKERGARYITRPDNKGAKAGNINHALQALEAEGPPAFFAVLDADFVPHRNFLRRTLALFHDPKTGIVQTPQHFFNADPMQHNLGLSRSYPDEQRFFFDHMQPARDAWGLAICCGTSSVVRWKAVSELGGLPTDSITEDYLLTLALQEHGWETHYLNESLTEGLAPEGLKEYITQRARWSLGLMQIARSRYGPFGRNTLRFRDRWSVLDSAFYWLTTFPFRTAAFIYPLLYWFCNVTVVDAEMPDVLSYFGVYFLWTVMAYNILAPGTLMPLLKDVSQHLGAIQITNAAVTGLLFPKGHLFSVTAKGGDRSLIQVQWQLMAPYIVLLVLTVTGLVIGIFWDRFAFFDVGGGKSVVLFWTIYNLFSLVFILIACVELPRRERHVADQPLRAIFAAEGDTPRRVWIASLTQGTARIRGQNWQEGTNGILQVPGVGDVEATVIAPVADGVRLLLTPDEVTNDALLHRLYTEGGAPNIGIIRLGPLVRDLARRLSFNRQA